MRRRPLNSLIRLIRLIHLKRRNRRADAPTFLAAPFSRSTPMPNIGLNIREVDGSASPSIVAASTSVAAFNVLTRRGVANRPVRIDRFDQFVERFGSYCPAGLGAYLVKGFFDNGGRAAYINRVVSSDPATGHLAASLSLKDAAAASTLRLFAGFRGAKDPGRWGDGLAIKVEPSPAFETRLREGARASIVSAAALPATADLSALPSLALTVDGTDQTITFQPADFADPANATPGEVAAAINARQSKVVAAINPGGKLVLTSSGEIAHLANSWTSVGVRAPNAATGFPAIVAESFAAPAAVAPTGATLRRSDAFMPGDALEITDPATPANRAFAKLMTRNDLTGAITWAPAIANIATWKGREIRVRAVRFKLIVAQGGTDPANVAEVWDGLSMEADTADYAPARLNHPMTGSRFVFAEDLLSASLVGADLPVGASFAPLAGGRDGAPSAADFVGDPAARTGFHAFDTAAVQLVACERSDPAVVIGGLAYCQAREDCMYVGATPEGVVGADAVAYGQAFQGRKVYGALYSPWIVVSDPQGVGDAPQRTIPPTGHIMGVYARIDGLRGVWKAPAGDEANLAGAIDVTYRMTDEEHTQLVKEGSVNGIRAMPRAGIVIDASRTLSTDTRWLYVNVRLLFNLVKSSLKDGLRWVRQEPNRAQLWNSINYGTVTPFLLGLWRRGAFGTGNPADVFTVICDTTNNPPDQVDQGILNLEVYFYPSRPAETILITVGQQPSGGVVAEQ
ncbi:phage tail sheath C-terminal domain-containing protein [Sphingomonas sp. Leaf34]|uniref:phage tail sheath C-terminal domain-containing protein n=1 Tax=Sphingomonas sp. Leaf34 TaxID=1736216 RepID=UPI00138F8ED4|nr:phage tail sheath C-terminal domain-containing protein [Sphingomonas sp. Leaf34]